MNLVKIVKTISRRPRITRELKGLSTASDTLQQRYNIDELPLLPSLEHLKVSSRITT